MNQFLILVQVCIGDMNMSCETHERCFLHIIERSSSKFHNERGLESYYNMFCEVFVYAHALFIMFIYVSPCMFVTIY